MQKPEGAEVAVVTVAGSAAVATDAPQRDRSNDGVLSKFVVCIVELPFIVIGVTLGISFIIAMITTIAINEILVRSASRSLSPPTTVPGPARNI